MCVFWVAEERRKKTHTFFTRSVESDLDYSTRRMSSSANSSADTDSSIVSRGEKRPSTPSDSPLPKKSRTALDQNNSWEVDSASSHGGAQDKSSHLDAGIDHAKVQLPSISTTFEDYRHEGRRASLPISHSESRVRHSPYPPTSLRQSYAASNNQSSALQSYTFPPVSEDSAESRGSARPRLTTDVNYGSLQNSYDSPYPHSGISNGTTPSSALSSSAFTSPMGSDCHRSTGLSPYSESENWNSSPSGIVRPNSTPGQMSSPQVKYDDNLRHASFSGPVSQAQMFAGSARISGQHERRPVQGIKSEWQFPNNEFVLPPNNNHYSPPMAPAPPSLAAAQTSPSRSPQGLSSSTLVDRPQRKRGKLPKETTDYLKAWLHRHSDHPYPSEEEKKQLCHATGLSMSQVSNWMINVGTR